MKKVIVFDFDKTLTYEDTMLGFFFHCGRQKSFFLFRAFEYAFFLVMRKFKLISNLRLKEHGIRIFISGRKREQLEQLSKEYSEKIVLKEPLMTKFREFNPNQDLVFIVTASFTDYVKPLFPDYKVVGSEFSFNDTNIGLKFHCYKKEKAIVLGKLGINKINVLFTDSISDIALAEISKETDLVVGDQIIQCSTVEEFKKALEVNKTKETTSKKIHQFSQNLFSRN